MSIRSRATRALTPRRMFVTTALTVVAALGFVVAAPGSDAFAAGPTSPQERVAFSIEHGHILDDVNAGKITEADIDAVSKTGLTVFGHHLDKWEGLTPEEEAVQAKDAAALRAAVDTDPETAKSIRALGSAQSDDQGAASLDSTATTSYRPAPETAHGSVTESKHWWNRVIHKIISHLPGNGPIPGVPGVPAIPHMTIFINNATIRAVLSAAAGAAIGTLCVVFPDISKLTCVIMAGAMAGLVEYIKTNGICGGHGISVVIPEFQKRCGH